MLYLFVLLLAIGGSRASAVQGDESGLSKREDRELYPVVTFNSGVYSAQTQVSYKSSADLSPIEAGCTGEPSGEALYDGQCYALDKRVAVAMARDPQAGELVTPQSGCLVLYSDDDACSNPNTEADMTDLFYKPSKPLPALATLWQTVPNRLPTDGDWCYQFTNGTDFDSAESTKYLSYRLFGVSTVVPTDTHQLSLHASLYQIGESTTTWTISSPRVRWSRTTVTASCSPMRMQSKAEIHLQTWNERRCV